VRSEIYTSLTEKTELGDKKLNSKIAEILGNQLEKFTEPVEDPDVAHARIRQGGLSGFSQKDDDDDTDSDEENWGGGGRKKGKKLISIENCISDVEESSASSNGGGSGSGSGYNSDDESDAKQFHPALIAAGRRVVEPLGQLIQAR